MEPTRSQRLFRFGVYEANSSTGELHKQGRRLRLQEQPFQVLLMLLERPGELVPREDIRQRLWPDGTFVDFDHGLNTAVNKIRDTLGDTAANPRFVETLARRGYRFIAPVEVVDGNLPPAAGFLEPVVDASPSTAELAPARGFGITLLTRPEEVPQPPRAVVRSLFFLVQLMYLCFYVVSLAKIGVVEDIVSTMMSRGLWIVVALVLTAAIGIPLRLYLISAVSFNAPGLREKFLRLFPMIFVLDELWAVAPFLLLRQIGFGLALGATAALVYLPFAQRSLILMGAGKPEAQQKIG